MKKTKFLRTTFLVLFSMCFMLLLVSANGDKTKGPSKSGNNKGRESKMQRYYIKFYVGGNEYVVEGFGGGSGTIETFVQGCVGGVLYSGGTASGSYTVSGGVMSISCTVHAAGTPPPGQSYGGAPFAFSGSALSITDCAGN